MRSSKICRKRDDFRFFIKSEDVKKDGGSKKRECFFKHLQSDKVASEL